MLHWTWLLAAIGFGAVLGSVTEMLMWILWLYRIRELSGHELRRAIQSRATRMLD